MESPVAPIHSESNGTLPRAAFWAAPAAVLWDRLFGVVARTSAWALLDQAVVSGTRFLTTVMVGRLCGQGELGLYSLGFGLVVLAASTQESLITLPYTIYGNRLGGIDRRRYAGAVLVHLAVLMLLATAGLAAAALVLGMGMGPGGLAPIVWILAATIPFALLWEFARRLAFAHLNVTAALALDAAVAVVQICGLLALSAGGKLSAVTAYCAMGVACAAVGLSWLWLARGKFIVQRRRVAGQFARNWSLGKWVFAGQLTVAVHAYTVHWMLAILLDTKATGEYVACWSVILLSNPIMLGISNVIAPNVAKAFAAGGKSELRRIVRKAAWTLTLVMGAFCAVAIVWGSRIVALLYGAGYAADRRTIAVLALTVLLQAMAMAAGNGLLAMERSRVNFCARLLGLGVTLAVTGCLVGPFGVLGGAYGLLAGSIAHVAHTLIAYRIALHAADANSSTK